MAHQFMPLHVLLLLVVCLLGNSISSVTSSGTVRRAVDFGTNCPKDVQQYDLCNDGRGYCDYPGNGKGRLKCYEGLECGAFPEVAHGSFVLTDPHDNVLGATAELTCCTGYHSDGAKTITCGINSTWSTPSGNCKANDCGSPPVVNNGAYATPFGTIYPAVGYITCNKTFVATYNSLEDTFLRCNENGDWVAGSATCEPECEPDVDCESTPSVDNGAYATPEVAKDCTDLQAQGATTSGVYTVTIDGNDVDVLCQMEDGSMWTVIQQRIDGTVGFYRGWDMYKYGFGDINGNFWLGLENIYNIVGVGTKYRVKFYITDSVEGNKTATYQTFKITDERDKYRLKISCYSGDAGDGMSYHSGFQFSTFDNDNDPRPTHNCAALYTGAWWYRVCHEVNLNGVYGNRHHGKGINWYWTTRYKRAATYTRIQVQPITP